MVLLLNLTVSYAQTGNVFIVNEDTLVGYNRSELQKIAFRIIKSHECDSLLSITEQQLNLKDSALTAKKYALSSKDSVIVNKDIIIIKKEDIIIGKSKEIKELRKDNKKLLRKLKLSKVAIYSSVGALFVSIMLLLTK